MTVYVLLFGRPCSGKSTVRKILVQDVRSRVSDVAIAEIDDFAKLDQIFREDIDFVRHVRTPDGGVKVVDAGVWLELNAHLIARLEVAEPDSDLTIVELARGAYLPFFEALPAAARSNSLVLYVRCSLEAAWQRNVERGASAPSRFISHEEMFSTFAEDDYDALQQRAGERLITIENEDSQQSLEDATRRVVADRILPLLQDDGR